MLKEHLASHCNEYRDRSPQYYIGRAERVSPTFKRVMEVMFTTGGAPERHYRSADGLLALARSTDSSTLDAACLIALERDRCNYSYLKSLIESGMMASAQQQDFDMPEHNNIRGAEQFK